MIRKPFGLMLTAALALSWAAPLCAAPMVSSHACCAGGKSPAPDHGQVPACCRMSESVPAAATVSAPAPAILCSVAIVAEPSLSGWISPARFVPASPQAPPGTHSGLSPPSSGQ